MSKEKTGMHSDLQVPSRFTVPQRIEHLILVLSFSLLGLTGLVQKYGLNAFSERLISEMGGIQMTRIIHRAAAIVFALSTLYHLIVLGYKFYVRRVRMTMIPTPKDAKDGFQLLLHNMFLRKEPPQMPRYNFAEKLEYWALIWGGIIMLVTGFMLWNPLITTMFLPGQFIPAAKAVHGGEAVLAVLAIIVWHFYNVHIKMFNKSMFTGKLNRHQMEEEHGAEWNEILSVGKDAEPFSAGMRRRRLVYMPVALVIAALGIGGIYWAATAETTAISTLPEPMSRPEIPGREISAPPPPEQPETLAAPKIPHSIAGQEQCLVCHSRPGIIPFPSNHQGRPVESCRICHKPGPVVKSMVSGSQKARGKSGGPKAVPHPTDKAPYNNCLACHGLGKVRPFPENHANASVKNCTVCHK
jgi:formate dehydrogenase gamma subunit